MPSEKIKYLVTAARLVAAGQRKAIESAATDPDEQKKVELFAIEAKLSDAVVVNYDELRFARSGLGLIWGHDRGWAPVTELSFSLLRAHKQAARAGLSTLDWFDGDNIDLLERSDHAADVRRAAQLIDELPARRNRTKRHVELRRPTDGLGESRRFEYRNGVWIETDASVVYNHIRPGIRFQSEFNFDTLTMVLQAIKRDDPGITADEAIEAAMRSVGLITSPARLNETQLMRFLDALTVSQLSLRGSEAASFERSPLHVDNYVYDKSQRRVRYVISPEEFAVTKNNQTDRQGRDPSAGKAADDEPAARDPSSAGEITGRGPLARINRLVAAAVTTVRSFVHDARGLKSKEGCPARIPLKVGEPHALERNWAKSLDQIAPIWRDTLPSRRLDPIPPAFERLQQLPRLKQIEVDNVLGVRVSIRQGAFNERTIESDSQETADALTYQVTADGLRISMSPDAALRPAEGDAASEPRWVTIRVPPLPRVVASGCDWLEVEDAEFLDAKVPQSGRLRSATTTARVEAGEHSTAICSALSRVEIDVAAGGRALLMTKGEPEQVSVSGEGLIQVVQVVDPRVDSVVVDRQLAAEALLDERWVRRYRERIPASVVVAADSNDAVVDPPARQVARRPRARRLALPPLGTESEGEPQRDLRPPSLLGSTSLGNEERAEPADELGMEDHPLDVSDVDQPAEPQDASRPDTPEI